MTAPLGGLAAIVTGGGSGIGAGIAEVLCEQGATVGLLGRRRQALEAVAERLTARGAKAFVATADVRDRGQCEAAIAELHAAMGRLDILVNNAGVGGPNGCAAPGPDRFDEVMRTNVDGVFHCCRKAASLLPDGGRIVTISSVLGRFGVPGYTAYCASKHAVVGMMKALALELAPRQITVNTICPGWVDTDMAKSGMDLMAQGMGTSYEEARKAALSAVPLGRILQPREIGELCAWLCSKAASGMTGQAISHCGGQVMW
jgi:NAD(P)-dependent dehydrogenase (short-subunit alcohol dehydrogenase family)